MVNNDFDKIFQEDLILRIGEKDISRICYKNAKSAKINLPKVSIVASPKVYLKNVIENFIKIELVRSTILRCLAFLRKGVKLCD